MSTKDDGGKGAAIQAAGYNIEQARKALEEVGIPPMEAQKIALERPELVGQLTAEGLGPSAMGEIGVDPRLKSAQMESLAGIKELSMQGLGPEDMAQFRTLGRTGAREEQARQSSILQDMAQRGRLDSGAQLAAQLASSQGAAERRAQEGERVAAEAAGARRAALQATGEMGSQIRGQEFAEASQKAQAADIINKFNVANRQQVAAQNLAERQRIGEAQAQTSNIQQQYNKELMAKQFQQEMQKQGAIAGAYSGAAQQQMQAAQLAKPKKSPLGTLIGAAAGAGAGSFAGPGGAQAGGQMGMQIGSMFENGGIADKNANLKDMYAKYQKVKSYANGGVIEPLNDFNRDIEGMMGDYAPYRTEAPLAPTRADIPLPAVEPEIPLVPLQTRAAGEPNARQPLTLKERVKQNVDDNANKDKRIAALKGLSQTFSDLNREEEEAPVSLGNLEIDPYKLGYLKPNLADGGIPEEELSRILDSGNNMYVGDKIPANVNDREIAVDIDGQQNLLDKLKGKRADEAINEGSAVLNTGAQEQLMALIQGETDELPEGDIVREATEEETNLHKKNEELERRLSALENMASMIDKV